MKSGTAECFKEWYAWMKAGCPKLKNVEIKKDKETKDEGTNDDPSMGKAGNS